MADPWETQYGFSTNNAADAMLDFDSDGMINRDEFIAGTNPTNALSVLKLALTATNKSVLQFEAQTNISYTVQFRTNFTAPNWNFLTNIAAQPSQVRTILVNVPYPVPDVERYYRIVTPQLP
jgi:hypothetical protein